MPILAEIKKGKRIMNREIDYGRFPRLRAVVAECGLETPEQKESAFRALVNCLVSKMVCKPDGTILGVLVWVILLRFVHIWSQKNLN